MKMWKIKHLELLLLLLLPWPGCRNANAPEVRRSVVLEKLPSSLVRTADSLMQVEQRLLQSEMPAFVLTNLQRQLGLLLVERAPEEALVYFERVVAHYNSEGREDDAAALHLFMAQVYDEKLRQYESALAHLKKAEAIWAKMNDGLKLGAVRQQEGLLEAKLGHTETGIQKVKQAIEFFEEEQQRDGVLSSLYDLARIAALAGQPKEGLTYLDEALTDWRAQRAYRQIVPANNLRLKLLLQDGQLEAAARVQAENDSLIDKTGAPWSLQLPFLQLSQELLERTGRQAELEEVRTRYRQLTDSLAAERLVYFDE